MLHQFCHANVLKHWPALSACKKTKICRWLFHNLNKNDNYFIFKSYRVYKLKPFSKCYKGSPDIRELSIFSTSYSSNNIVFLNAVHNSESCFCWAKHLSLEIFLPKLPVTVASLVWILPFNHLFFISEYQLAFISHYFHFESLEEPSADLYIFWDTSEAISALANIPIGMTFHTIYI